MALIDSNIDEAEIKRYLFGEMDPGERNEFDQRLIENDGLFYDVADLENKLVDDYVRGDLADDDGVRFERSLEKIPERRQKVANATSLREFIDESRPVSVVEGLPERQSIWQQLAGLLGGKTPALAYGMGAMLVVLAVSTVVLIFQNQEKRSEIATLQEREQRQQELQKELDSMRQRDTELKNSIDSERETSGDLQDELDRERSRREEIERELGKLKNATTPQASGPIIASVFLLPGGRGGTGGPIPDVKIGSETKRLSMRVSLPDNVTGEDRLTVRLNQKVTAKDMAPRTSGGKKTINVTVPAQDLRKGENQLEVTDVEGKSVSSYGFKVINR